MKILHILLAALLFLSPSNTMAWGVLGHRVTGGIAELYLTPKAKVNIRKLLGNESVAIASNWADFIKSDSNYNYLSSWHYVDLRGGLSASQFKDSLLKDTATDLNTRLNFIIGQLKIKTLSKDKKVFYLKLLIHLVGDAHQPMHVAHPEDKGGNDIRLFWFGTPTNLHRVWDENLIEFQQLSYSEYIAWINHATAAQVKQWQQQPLNAWLYESYSAAADIYTEIHPDDRLGYLYNFNHIQLLNDRLLKAGVRLAGLLNQLFG